MRFCVLGTLHVSGGERDVPLGGPKQRTVLALLLAAHGKPLTIDTLIRNAYGEDAAPSVRRSIQTYVSNLRQELGTTIERRRDGYALAVAKEQLDADVFESKFRAGADLVERDPEVAAALLRGALRVWRGHAYADIEPGPLIEIEITRLNELRLATLESRIDADLALGLHRDLIGELEALVAEHPFRERLRAQLMLALYRSSRQADALRAYSRTRKLFVEELGLDPGRELQQLEQQILDQDPGLDLAVPPTVERLAIIVSDLADELRSAPPSTRDDALAERDEALAKGLEAHNGRTIGLRGTAAYASFVDIEAALRVAQMVAGDRVRVAVDLGDVEVREDSLTGPPLVRAARLVAAVHAGQVLVSESAHTALVQAAASGWTLTSLGRYQLRGVENSVLVYQLAVPGLPDEFPSLLLDRLPPPLPVGHNTVTGYELREQIADDGHSVVYRGYQASLGRLVAVRMFHPGIVADPAFIRRFEAESQRLAALSHPHLVPVLDYWRDANQAVLVTRAPGSRTLADLDGSLPLKRVVELTAGAGSALAYAHRSGVLHGALTPEAIAVDDDGNAAVSGLGIEHIVGDLAPARLGLYSAPETLDGAITPRADVYSLGAIAAELLTGEQPSLDGSAASITGPGGEVVALATAADPEERIATIQGLIEGLVAAAADPVLGHVLTAVRNPFKGLNAFLESDAEDFRGRDALITQLVAAVGDGVLTVVVGPSGVGKSSVVRAGLIPALRNGAARGSDGWLFTDMFPRHDPFEELATALARVAIRDPATEMGGLRSRETSLVDACDRVAGGQTVVIVIDQFEELYTAATAEAREAFLDMLAEAARSGSLRLRLIVTLRADFYHYPLRDADFGQLVGERSVAVHAMGIADLEEAVRLPAEGVGVAVDDDVVTAVATAVAGEAGALPLLEYTLTEMFDQRDHDRIAMADYRRVGGAVGSIGRRAEAVYMSLPPAGRAAAQDVFVRLVTVDEESDDTRRRVRRGELERLPHPRAEIEAALQAFGNHRLLTFDRDAATRGPTVEVAHEALLREWPRLREWIDAIRDDLLVGRRIEVAARDWGEAGRDPSYLLGGARLDQAEEWVERGELPLSEVERDYLDTSRQCADEVARRRRRNRRRVLAALVAGLVIVSVLGLLAAVQGREAHRQALENRMQELSSEALVAMDEDPDLAILLALSAYDTSLELGQTPPEVVASLQKTVQTSRLQLVLDDIGEVVDAAVGEDGGLIAIVAEGGTVLQVHDGATGERKATRSFPEVLGGVAFTPDGRIAAVRATPDAAGQQLILMDPLTLETTREAPGTGVSYGLELSDDGRYLVSWADSGTRVWDTQDEFREFSISGLPGVMIPGTATMAVLRSGAIEFVDIETDSPVDRIQLEDEGINAVSWGKVAYDPNTDSVAFVDQTTNSVETRRRADQDKDRFGDFSLPQVVKFTPDGTRLIVGGTDPIVNVIDLETGKRTALPGHGSSVTGMWASDTTLVVQTLDSVRVWSIEPGHLVATERIEFDPADILMMRQNPAAGTSTASRIVSSAIEAVDLVDTATGSLLRRVEFYWATWEWPLLSDDGSLALGLDPITQVGVTVDMTNGARLLDLRPCELPRAVDADSRLVAVVGGCPISGAVDPDPVLLPRTAVIEIDTGEMAFDLGSSGFVLWAWFGRAGTPAEDLLFVNRETGKSSRDLEVWRVSTGTRIGTWRSEQLLAVLPSHDGKNLVAGHQTGVLAVFDIQAIADGVGLADALRFIKQAHPGSLRYFDAADGVVVTAADEVRVWNVETGDLIVDLGSWFRPAVTMTDDGSAFYLEVGNGVMGRIPLVADDLAELARSVVNRGFTDEECSRFFPDEDCPDYH